MRSLSPYAVVAAALQCVSPGLALAAESASEHEFSANVAYTSDYIYRGLSQTSEEPALQGGFDYKHGSGFYLGTWASSLNFGDGSGASVEMDVYGGYAGSRGDLGYDVGLLYYGYPGVDSGLDYDFVEAYGSGSYDFGGFSLTGGAHYSPDFFGGTGSATYAYLSAGVPLAAGFSLSALAARQWIEDADDYLHWSLGVATELQGFGLDLSYHDTDIDDSAIADARLVLTVSRAF